MYETVPVFDFGSALVFAIQLIPDAIQKNRVNLSKEKQLVNPLHSHRKNTSDYKSTQSYTNLLVRHLAALLSVCILIK